MANVTKTAPQFVLSISLICISGVAWGQATNKQPNDVIHDAEQSILAAQRGEQWSSDERAIERRLAEVRQANGGKRPNIVYILLDDIGYGEIGTPGLTPVTTSSSTTDQL